MDNNTVYIHYGHDKFDRDAFNSIQNGLGSKPLNGFWASRMNSLNGWKNLNEKDGMVVCSDDYAIRFTISDKANIYHISTKEDWDSLYEIYGIGETPDGRDSIDWVKMASDGYDGVEMTTERIGHLAYTQLWDCDSICVFNPDIIQEIERDISNDFRKINGIEDTFTVYIPRTVESENKEFNEFLNLKKLSDFVKFCRGCGIDAKNILQLDTGNTYEVTVSSDIQYRQIMDYAEEHNFNIDFVYRKTPYPLQDVSNEEIDNSYLQLDDTEI